MTREVQKGVYKGSSTWTGVQFIQISSTCTLSHTRVVYHIALVIPLTVGSLSNLNSLSSTYLSSNRHYYLLDSVIITFVSINIIYSTSQRWPIHVKIHYTPLTLMIYIYIYIYVELSLDYVEVIWYIKRETRG